ncbi:MAG: hypothetical protein ACI87E_004294 [Mariniblastus sp.]|jgi:hypothetical protein
MSALAWIFGLGVLAVGFPLLFHLIKRTPKGQTQFSSLMFLKPTPPMLTRRSRLENILLLLLRAAAICLIAFAFMRPFFRGTETLTEIELANRRVAILVDTSASLQRQGLWEQTKERVTEILDDLDSGDDVALYAFDQQIREIVGFESTASDDSDQPSLIREGMDQLEPGWKRSDLGQALVTLADQMDVWRDSMQAKNGGAPSKLQILVVSDLQDGSTVDSLQSYQWPSQVFVDFKLVVPDNVSNATIQLLDQVEEEAEPGIRVRVANSEDSKLDQFFVSWGASTDIQNDERMPFYVPGGTSRVLNVEPDLAISAQQFSVFGDQEDFDNTFFVVPPRQQELTIAYLGTDESDDPEFPQYYLRRALIETSSRLTRVREVSESDRIVEPSSPTLLVVTSLLEASRRDEVQSFLDAGGTMLVVLTEDLLVEQTAAWTGARLEQESSTTRESTDDYSMLSEIDFASSLFQPFANPLYNDFTKIKFWNHRSVELNESTVRVLARFDDEAPAVWLRELERGGRVYTLATGWHPRQSQLALSTKFVPFINGLVEIAADLPKLERTLLVGEPIEFPKLKTGQEREMIAPDGTVELITADQTRFSETNQPGIYRLVAKSMFEATDEVNQDAVNVEILFAVNVDRRESKTTAIPIEKIEMYGVNVGQQDSETSELAQMREMRDRDLESSQKVWKWLILVAIGLLIFETWLAGRTSVLQTASNTTSVNVPTGQMQGETS